MLIKWITALSILLFCLTSMSSSSLSFPVEKYQLKNGLTVLLYENRDAPIVSYHTWVKVGSKDEEPGFTGIAHLFEHLMFKGSKKYSNKDYERILREIGATNNAFTSRDYTGYYVNLPSDKLELVMDLESDRFQNLILNEQALQSEREVVKEERRFRVENRIQGVVFEQISELAYTSHSYKWPVIGYIADLNNITLEKAQQFYKTYYSPNNAVLVIAGDFETKKVKRWVEKYYGSMPAQEIKRPVYPIEPIQTTQRQNVFYRDIQSDYLTVSFVLPSQTSDEIYSLELLSEILGKGDSSRLHKKLVYEDQIATAVYSFVMSNYHSSMLQIHVMLKPTKNKEQADLQKNKALSQIWTELFRLRSYDVNSKELMKAQNSVIKEYIDRLKTLDGKAYSLAMNETVLSDYSRFFSDLEKYRMINSKNIKKSANAYLTQNKANIVLARPEKFK